MTYQKVEGSIACFSCDREVKFQYWLDGPTGPPITIVRRCPYCKTSIDVPVDEAGYIFDFEEAIRRRGEEAEEARAEARRRQLKGIHYGIVRGPAWEAVWETIDSASDPETRLQLLEENLRKFEALLKDVEAGPPIDPWVDPVEDILALRESVDRMRTEIAIKGRS